MLVVLFLQSSKTGCLGKEVEARVMVTPDMQLNAATSEYGAIRSEILERLKFQQQVVQYSFLVAGLLAPILAFRNVIDVHFFLAILLIGPLICAFLLMIYIKHHLFLTELADYINSHIVVELHSDDTSNKQEWVPFRGWEDYLTLSLYERALPNWVSSIIGFAEGGFSLIIAILYLVLFLALGNQSTSLNTFVTSFLWLWFLIDLVTLAVVVVVGIRIRSFVRDRRVEAAKDSSTIPK
jgi:hypothetical protein